MRFVGRTPPARADWVPFARLARQSSSLLQTSFVANCAVQKDFEGPRFHRLFQKPECLEVMDGGQRLFHAAETGERDRRGTVPGVVQVPEQFKAVHPRHDQIRDDDVCVEGSEPFQRFLPVGGDLSVKVALAKQSRQRPPLTLVIIDDEDPARSRRGAPGRKHCAGYVLRVECLGEHGETPYFRPKRPSDG